MVKQHPTKHKIGLLVVILYGLLFFCCMMLYFQSQRTQFSYSQFVITKVLNRPGMKSEDEDAVNSQQSPTLGTYPIVREQRLR